MLKNIFRTLCAAFVATAFCTACADHGSDSSADHGQTPDSQRAKPAGYVMPARMDSLRPQLERNLKTVFNDSNHLQLPHAMYMGIEPIENVNGAYRTSRPIVKIVDTEKYQLDSLTHSVPYLVPEAANLLSDISQAFADTLAKRHLPPVKPKVTSLLRTKASVKRLRRVNRNATQHSTHQYATTFDISYRGFYTPAGTEVYDPRYRLALAEAIYDLRAADRCMVKYEIKSPCFHITVIK